jgi:hypothetical protein
MDGTGERLKAVFVKVAVRGVITEPVFKAMALLYEPALREDRYNLVP